ncbi:MAG: tyrosine--tRNA ligase [Candidatus Wildermuthbacteria bacterium]|nr:tyrosine--tRNA ligase [Candidatus Wildermuthbacteria bacterium]
MNINSKIEEVLTRGVEHIYPSRKELENALVSGKKLRIYYGIDPTGKLHVGHVVGLRKMRQLQDLGHEIIILIGDFTATIGDPTGKGTARKPLSRKQVLANAKDYKKQIGKIVDLKKSNVRFLHNEKWSGKLKPEDLLGLASQFTVAGLLERDMFQERIKAGKEIYVHEFLYPIFQAYDSATMNVDLEVGGNDQIFNMLAGRTLLKKLRDKEKFVLALKLLTDPSGKKMGKSEGNMVNLDENPNSMFGKVMSWPDELIAIGFELLTDISLRSVELMKERFGRTIQGDMLEFEPIAEELRVNLDARTLNRDLKQKLAFEIVKQCHGEKIAKAAEEEFVKVFREKKQPEAILEVHLGIKEMSLLELLVSVKFAESKSDARRLVEQGGVKIDDILQTDPNQAVSLKEGMVIQAGPHRFIRIA